MLKWVVNDNCLYFVFSVLMKIGVTCMFSVNHVFLFKGTKFKQFALFEKSLRETEC